MSEVENTKYFVERKHDLDAIREYAKQKGFMTVHIANNEEYVHYHNINSIDEIIELAVSEGLFEFYENNGTCYRLTKKGVQKFPH